MTNLDEDRDYLLHGDALTTIASLPADSFDLIYLDPPFGTGTVRHNRGRKYADKLSQPQQFIEWLAPILSHSHRLLRHTGSLILHLDYRTVHYAKVSLDEIFGTRRFVNEIIWCYATGGKSTRAFGRKHDSLLWYSKSADYRFFPDAIRVPRKSGSHMRVVTDEHGNQVQEKTDAKTGKVYRYPIAAGKVPEDWWTDIPVLNHSAKERVGWPTQKPEALLQRLTCATTEPGDRVGDWFCGSGTTAAVARRLKRQFVTIDREAEAIAVASERLARLDANKTLQLNLPQTEESAAV